VVLVSRIRRRDSKHVIMSWEGFWTVPLSEPLDMHRLKAEYLARRAKRIALLESFVIVGLLLALTLEYENNAYMRLWVLQNMWPVGYLLNGTLLGLMAGLLVGWTIASWQGRRSREQKILDDLRKIV
jgi:hypothetical protein